MKNKSKKEKALKLMNTIKEDYRVELFFVIANLINTILLRLFTTGNFVVRSIFFDLGFLLIVVSLSFLVKRKKLYFGISSLITVACCVINSIYYNYYNSLYQYLY